MARKTTKLVAEICLYGNGAFDVGYGWLARLADGTLLGDGEPRPTVMKTDCIFRACDAISATGLTGGLVRVFSPGGGMMADTDLNHPGYFGDLKWQPATVYVVTAEQIEAAAK